MAWLRLDDGYDSHPKILQLTETERWRWTRVLLHCARHRTAGHISAPVLKELGLGRTITRLTTIGLLEAPDGEGAYTVHDWERFNPKDPGAAERMRKNRERAPRVNPATWNETRDAVFARDQGICADCGDRDEDAFAKGLRSGWNADHEPPREELVEAGISIYDLDYIVTRCHSCHAKKTRRQANNTRTTGEPTTEPEPNGSPPRAQARARVPVPSLSTSNSQPGLDARRERVEEEARLAAWATRAQAPDVRSPQAFINAGMRTGGWPDPAPGEQQRVTVNGSAPDDAGCPSCGVGGGEHAGDCELAVGAARTMAEAGEDLMRVAGEAFMKHLEVDLETPGLLEDGDNRTEEQ